MPQTITPNFDREVRALLEKRRGDWEAIAKKAEVSHSWIYKFVNRGIRNPGYQTLVDIYKAAQEVPQSDKPKAH